jgi:Family of unknown function (DUF6962)
MALLEPAVALTDLGLALEGIALAALVRDPRARDTSLQNWFVLFFVALAMAAFLGFITHGFIIHKMSLTNRLVWRAILVAIGVISLSAWAIGARLIFSARTARVVTLLVALALATYAAVVLSHHRSYAFAVIAYLPAALFLLGAFLQRLRRAPTPGLRSGIAGLLLTLAAAGVQQLGIGLHPVWLNHNALYHLIQAIGLWLIYCAARGLVRAEPA